MDDDRKPGDRIERMVSVRVRLDGSLRTSFGRSLWVAVVSILFAFVFNGCDDGDDGTAIEIRDPGQFQSSGTDRPDMMIGELDDSELDALCAEMNAWSRAFVEDNREGLCHATAILAAQSILNGIVGVPPDSIDANQVCAQAETQCLENPDLLDQSTTLTECPVDTTTLQQCNVTVDELEACYNATQTLWLTVMEVAATTRCESVTATEPALPPLAPPLPCVALQQKCPEAFGTTGTGTGLPGG